VSIRVYLWFIIALFCVGASVFRALWLRRMEENCLITELDGLFESDFREDKAGLAAGIRVAVGFA
jgi:hypothetical protein